jgi:hypothetical protein
VDGDLHAECGVAVDRAGQVVGALQRDAELGGAARLDVRSPLVGDVGAADRKRVGQLAVIDDQEAIGARFERLAVLSASKRF